jgi:hypothetical protein
MYFVPAIAGALIITAMATAARHRYHKKEWRRFRKPPDDKRIGLLQVVFPIV